MIIVETPEALDLRIKREDAYRRLVEEKERSDRLSAARAMQLEQAERTIEALRKKLQAQGASR